MEAEVAAVQAEERAEAFADRLAARFEAGIGPWAEQVAGMVAGRELFETVTNVEPGEMDACALVELIAGCSRLTSHLAAVQADLVGELVARRDAGGVSASAVADEIAARLTLTGYGAAALVGRAGQLGAAPQVRDALAAGCIDVRKADLLLDRTSSLPAGTARAVQQELLAIAGDLTAPQLRARVDRAVLAADPDTAAKRHAAAVKTRGVSLTPDQDGMAWLTAYLPATDAMSCFTALDLIAGGPTAGDERTVGNRRADALVQLCEQPLTTGVLPDGTPVPTTRQGSKATVCITVAATTLAGEDELPAHLDGYGPITPGTARDIAAGPCRQRIITTDPLTGTYRSSTDAPAPATGQEPVTTNTKAPPDRPTPRQEPVTTATAPTDRSAPDRRSWDHPALIRYVTTTLAEEREPAGDGGGDGGGQGRTQRPRRPVQVLAEDLELLATDSYTPGARLRRLIVERDRTCTFPGCPQPAWRCQLDHIVPFEENVPAWAQTVETNLHALCTHHHQAKTSRRWQVTRNKHTGTTTWTAPTGHVYTRLAETLDHLDLHDLLAATTPGEEQETEEEHTPWHGTTPGQPPTWDQDEIQHYLDRTTDRNQEAPAPEPPKNAHDEAGEPPF